MVQKSFPQFLSNTKSTRSIILANIKSSFTLIMFKNAQQKKKTKLIAAAKKEQKTLILLL